MRILPTRPSELARLVALVFSGAVAVFVVSAAMPALLRLPDPRPGCETPIRYRFGVIDPRFPLGEGAFRKATIQAEAVWESALGRDILRYDPTADFVVTTEFDGRQQMTYDSRTLENRIAEYETTAETISAQYDTRKATYEHDKTALESRIAEYETGLRNYNRDVSQVNARGGATEEEFEELKDAKESLEDKQEAISDEADRLRVLAAELNALAARLETETADVNAEVTSFRETYGEPQPFVQGLYDPNVPSITIYQFERQEDLRLVLAHEFGHALGIGEHVEDDSSALMYYLMDGQDVLHPALTAADIEAYTDQACRARTETLRERIVRSLVETPVDGLSLNTLFSAATERLLLAPGRTE